jgi:cytochrome P450
MAGMSELGEALQTLIGTPEGRADPYPLYDVIRSAGPTVRVSDTLLLVIGHAEVGAALRDGRLRVQDNAYAMEAYPDYGTHSAARTLGHSVLEANSPDHERMRRLVNGSFTPRRLSHLREAIAELVADLLDGMAGSDDVDFMRDFAYPLPVNVICELLGVPAADRAWFRPVAQDMTSVLEPMLEDLSVADAACDQLEAYFTDLIAAKRKAPGEDLTSALVATHDESPHLLSLQELLSNLTVLLVAGFETTTNLLGNGLVALLDNPVAMAALRAAPAMVGDQVEEMLRFDSPVQLTSRIVEVPTEVFGETMPRHAEIFMMIGGANRDPRRFRAPASYDPFRADNAPLSFGAGAHYCIGNALARMEAQVAFPMLLERFGGIERRGEPVRRDRITLRGFASMPVTVTPAGPLSIT